MTCAVAELEVILDDRKQRHDLFCRPAGTTTGRPFVERVRNTADGDLAVHHGTAAKALAAPVEAGLLSCHPAGQQIRPLPFLLILALVNDRNRVRRPDFPGRLISAPVEARFQQQHAPGGILGEPGGNRGTGRAAADYNGVIHRVTSRCSRKSESPTVSNRADWRDKRPAERTAPTECPEPDRTSQSESPLRSSCDRPQPAPWQRHPAAA